MNLDIISTDGPDLGLIRSDVSRAGNVLSIQLGDLEYAPSFGVDLRYFLESDFMIQNDSFKAYLVQRLMESQVNVVNALSVFETLFEKITFLIGDDNNGTGLVG